MPLEHRIDHRRRYAVERNVDALLGEEGERRLPRAVVDDRGLGAWRDPRERGCCVELGNNCPGGEHRAYRCAPGEHGSREHCRHDDNTPSHHSAGLMGNVGATAH